MLAQQLLFLGNEKSYIIRVLVFFRQTSLNISLNIFPIIIINKHGKYTVMHIHMCVTNNKQ